jgi:fatty-acyl-CoA synthase
MSHTEQEMTFSQLGKVPLSPLSFLRRSAAVFADRTAVIDGERSYSYSELERRVARMAALLDDRGIARGDRVAVLAPNTPLLLEAHFAVPALGAVLVALNFRLTPRDLDRIVAHAGARLLLFDDELAEAAGEIAVERLAASALEDEMSRAGELRPEPFDEEALISLNYTSGTTGDPKGVMYVHRGAYLQALAMAYHSGMGPGSVHLWTLPMFHCNGWSFPWAVTAAGATHACLRKVEPALAWESIRRNGVTHMNAAPTVLLGLANDPSAAPVEGAPLRIGTGGAPPAPALLARLAELNNEITHL